MSTENTNAAATAGKDTPSPKPKRGWFRRNWLWFLPTLILAIVVVGGGVVYWSVFVRVYRLDVCQSAMKAIQSDKVLQQKLGQPIHPVWWPSREFTPSSRIEKEEKEVRWKIEGPKGRASAHVQAKLRMGEWQTIIFDVTLADGKKISLNEADGGEAPPVWQPPKPGDKKSDNAPPPDINMDIPSDIPTGK